MSTLVWGVVPGQDETGTRLVSVGVETRNDGIPGFEVLGLPEREGRLVRADVRTALRAAGYALPRHVSVRLSPDLSRSQWLDLSMLDLSVAMGVLVDSGQVERPRAELPYAGELLVDGSLAPRPAYVRSWISAAARRGLGEGTTVSGCPVPGQTISLRDVAAGDVARQESIGTEPTWFDMCDSAFATAMGEAGFRGSALPEGVSTERLAEALLVSSIVSRYAADDEVRQEVEARMGELGLGQRDVPDASLAVLGAAREHADHIRATLDADFALRAGMGFADRLRSERLSHGDGAEVPPASASHDVASDDARDEWELACQDAAERTWSDALSDALPDVGSAFAAARELASLTGVERADAAARAASFYSLAEASDAVSYLVSYASDEGVRSEAMGALRDSGIEPTREALAEIAWRMAGSHVRADLEAADEELSERACVGVEEVAREMAQSGGFGGKGLPTPAPSSADVLASARGHAMDVVPSERKGRTISA